MRHQRCGADPSSRSYMTGHINSNHVLAFLRKKLLSASTSSGTGGELRNKSHFFQECSNFESLSKVFLGFGSFLVSSVAISSLTLQSEVYGFGVAISSSNYWETVVNFLLVNEGEDQQWDLDERATETARASPAPRVSPLTSAGNRNVLRERTNSRRILWGSLLKHQRSARFEA